MRIKVGVTDAWFDDEERPLNIPLRIFARCIFVALFGVSMAVASSISFSVPELNPTIAPGEFMQFNGTIVNATGVDLSETELFFNAVGFDPSVLLFTQLLGTILDNAVPSAIQTGPLPLFDIGLTTTALAGSSYPLTITLEDVNGNVSDRLNIVVAAGSQNGSPIPEPRESAALLFSIIAVAIGIVGSRRTRLQ